MDAGNLKEGGVIEKFMAEIMTIEDDYFKYVETNKSNLKINASAKDVQSIRDKYRRCFALIED